MGARQAARPGYCQEIWMSSLASSLQLEFSIDFKSDCDCIRGSDLSGQDRDINRDLLFLGAEHASTWDPAVEAIQSTDARFNQWSQSEIVFLSPLHAHSPQSQLRAILVRFSHGLS